MTPDYVLRFAGAIAPGNAELLLTGGTEEDILNAATDTISDLRKRIAELEAAIDVLTLNGADCYALVLALEEREEKYRLRIAELEAALSKEAQR